VQQLDPAAKTVHEGEYLPPNPPRSPGSGTWKGIGAGAVGIGVLLAKFKTLLFFLLSFKWILLGGKLLLSGATFFASVWFYAIFWGWKFAFVFVLLILIHELGHVAAMRLYGVPASMPFFIPGMGALVTMKGSPASQKDEAYIAFAGPMIGTLASLLCYVYGDATGDPFWHAVAYTGFFLNLFNLAPVLPLDGGRVAGAVSPRIWIFGLIAMIVAVVAFHLWNPLIVILIVLSIPRAIAAWRGQLDPAYHNLTALDRGGIAFAYFALAGFLFAAMLVSRVTLPT